jgi:hypothetical protein
MPSLIRLMFVHGATALVACGLIFGVFLLMRASVQWQRNVCKWCAILHLLENILWVLISYHWIHIPSCSSFGGHPPRSHHSCTLTVNLINLTGAGAGWSVGWRQGHGRIVSLTTILLPRMYLMAILIRVLMEMLHLQWKRASMSPNRRNCQRSKRILCPTLGQFGVRAGHQARDCKLCLTQVLFCQKETAAVTATRAPLLCIVQPARGPCSPPHLQVSSQSDLLALAAGCERRSLKKMGVPSPLLPDLLLACQLGIPNLEHVTAWQDQSVMMRALQALLLFLTICRQHSLQGIKHDLTAPQSSVQEHQRKMGGPLQRSACHSPFLRI